MTSEGGGAVIADVPAVLHQLKIALDTGRVPDVPVPEGLRITRTRNEPGPLNDCVRTFGKWAVIASEKLQGALAKAGVDNIHWYPLTIDDVIAQQQFAYWCGNIIGVVDCIDETRTVKDDVGQIRRLWIEPRAAKGLKLFRLYEYEEVHILVRRDVKIALENSGCTGLKFVPANGFCDLAAEPMQDDLEADDFVPWC